MNKIQMIILPLCAVLFASAEAAVSPVPDLPGKNWEISFLNNYIYQKDGRKKKVLMDVDADGQPEFVALATLFTKDSARARLQLYDGKTGELKTSFPEQSLNLQGGYQGHIFVSVTNVDPDPQKEVIFSVFKSTITAAGEQNVDRKVIVYDGETRKVTWKKDFGDGSEPIFAEGVDIDGDGVNEVAVNIEHTAVYYYKGDKPTEVLALIPEKPAPDWTFNVRYGTIVDVDGDKRSVLQDIDGDGNKEFLVFVSSYTANSNRSKFQLYASDKGGLKWQSYPMLVERGSGEAVIDWEVTNLDKDMQKEIICSTYHTVPGSQYGLYADRTIIAVDGQTKRIAWSKNLGNGTTPPEIMPVDLEDTGISDLSVLMDNSSLTIIDGETGAQKSRILFRKPAQDWKVEIPYPVSYDWDGDRRGFPMSVHKTGELSVPVFISTASASSCRARYQLLSPENLSPMWQSGILAGQPAEAFDDVFLFSQFGHMTEDQIREEKVVFDSYAKLLRASSSDRRKKAITGLAKIHSSDAMSLLLSSLNTEDNPSVKAHLIRVLGAMKDQQINQEILVFVNDKNKEIREAAQGVLWSQH